ncbi:hypothetical protein [Salipaludibacillus daqingensis]|uniref:hypothetical protein n=1 Tax=Salipaludibacillus daqingensis TaxID=3041001 RepID=UPI00247712C3|nr:hypothetical protein [Salipaludibacillus daqingensis]
MKSIRYQNAKTKLLTICPNGHDYPVSFNAFQDKSNGKRGSRCSECCDINKPHTQEYVEEYISQFGYKLHSESNYRGTKAGLLLICPDGHHYPTTFDNFKNRGRRCTDCGGRRNTRYSLNEVRTNIENEGYKLISESYQGVHETLHLKCPEYHDYFVQFDKFNNSGDRCGKCWEEKRIHGENHPNWKGGISTLSTYLRRYINNWKRDSLAYYGEKCIITGADSNIIIHHLYSFQSIVLEVLIELKYQLYESISEYSNDQLKAMSVKCLEIHYRYPLGVPLEKHVHEEFHSIYTKDNNTPEQFFDFLQRNNTNMESVQNKSKKLPRRKRNALTDSQAISAWERRKSGESCRRIAQDLGVSGSTIENLVNGKSYKHLALSKVKPRNTKLDEKQVLTIRKELIDGAFGTILAKKFKVSTSIISAIRRGSLGHSKSRFKDLSPLPAGKTKLGRLSERDILEIRSRGRIEGLKMIAKDFGISRQLVSDIMKGRRYKHVSN